MIVFGCGVPGLLPGVGGGGEGLFQGWVVIASRFGVDGVGGLGQRACSEVFLTGASGVGG